VNHDFLSAFILLLLVLDPFGSLPIYISVLRGVAPPRRRVVALRESLIAFAVLAAFMLGGQVFLDVMRLSERSLEVAGGVILLIIAVRMIFSRGSGVYEAPAEHRALHLSARRALAGRPLGHGICSLAGQP
jgi:small neutral amino acid transporter SnatA (MarC family)